MEETLKKYRKQHQEDELQDDDDNGSYSNEDDDEDDDDDDDDDDDEDDRRRRNNLNKRTSHGGFGSAQPAKKSTVTQQKGTPPPPPPPPKKKQKRTKRKGALFENSDEFTKEFLAEKAHVERLVEDGFYNEDTDHTNWWNYEKEMDPSLEDLVDDSGGKLDSNSVEAYYTFGGKRKPNPPTSPDKPEQPQSPVAPPMPHTFAPKQPPPMPRPPNAPVVRVPESLSSSSSPTTNIGNFFRSIFGFGTSANNVGTFSTDPFFQGFQRSMPDGTPTIVTVDKTKEILTTAIEIGETLRSPNQCNSLFNGCKYQYIELLHVIDDIRKSLASRGKDDFETVAYGAGVDDEVEDDKSSFGYKFSLSGTSQAETLAPDYPAAESEVSKKKQRKKKKSQRRKKTSMSKESAEIASDEPTLYGSAQQNYNYHRRPKHGPVRYNSHNFHHYSQHANNHHNGHHQSYLDQYDEAFNQQPKSIWGTILSWFGFRR